MSNFLLFFLISQADIVTILTIVLIFFGILLFLGVRKSYKLKKENERLNSLKNFEIDENKPYQDFTEGHMYENKNTDSK
ncbi:hypothetical protein [Aestuariivivens sediminis]|uniref:hypothetical protein n=1 Tax=Aestuariivivens sediminis TaxID=2913557 RepID=UPI001F58662B|nr:hypothetical protein [Aestuariivivens sediminis]